MAEVKVKAPRTGFWEYCILFKKLLPERSLIAKESCLTPFVLAAPVFLHGFASAGAKENLQFAMCDDL